MKGAAEACEAHRLACEAKAAAYDAEAAALAAGADPATLPWVATTGQALAMLAASARLEAQRWAARAALCRREARRREASPCGR